MHAQSQALSDSRLHTYSCMRANGCAKLLTDLAFDMVLCYVGTLMELGISPIVTSGLIMQVSSL